ncbi:MAG: pitrilysin family protein, partial [bacterium]
TVLAGPAAAAGNFWQSWADRVVETRLPNGFTLLVVERPTSPTVACWMFCRAGAAQEARGQTGLAHLLEHMLFKGTESVGTTDHIREKPFLDEQDRLADEILAEESRTVQDQARLRDLRRRLETSLRNQRALTRPEEYGEILRRHGGVNLNAGTSLDYTVYHVELPANRLELWAALESDRLLHPVFREFYKERDVVMEERRRSRDSQPDGALFEQFLSAAFTAHPYGVPTIGWADDIRRLQRKDAEAFYRTQYTADRFVAVIVGDVKAEAVTAMVTRYFGALPAGSGIRLEPTAEPTQKGERRITVEFDASPQVIMGYHRPTQPHPDVYALDVLSQILTGGRTGRLYRRLSVRERKTVSIWSDGSFPGARYPNLFVIGFIPR